MTDALKQYLIQGSFALSEEKIAPILSFYELVLKENETQNLTRLTSPSDFYYGHVVDVLELLKSFQLQYPILDLGSGVGVPGILVALLADGEWVLAESEKRKAEYLQQAVLTFNLGSRVKVFPGRAETYLKGNSLPTVIARAVGPVERIYSWIRSCSTWNNLILFKGPGWTDEWADFQKGRYRRELSLEKEHLYTVGPENKSRRIVHLIRK